ncbi:hypothetical protein LTR10_006785 [Elasticomyces elasticus]|nr:hypothetical protein LTR10_006785 [Elasticomyces elasticus]KAK4972814.1 hypothetical protein LTR42_006108 [Elasticomyces elasticus]
MAPAKQKKTGNDPKVHMQICGLTAKSKLVELRRNTPDTREAEQALLRGFKAYEHYSLTWHFEDESCFIHRAFYDLFPGSQTSVPNLNGDRINLHLHEPDEPANEASSDEGEVGTDSEDDIDAAPNAATRKAGGANGPGPGRTSSNAQNAATSPNGRSNTRNTTLPASNDTQTPRNKIRLTCTWSDETAALLDSRKSNLKQFEMHVSDTDSLRDLRAELRRQLIGTLRYIVNINEVFRSANAIHVQSEIIISGLPVIDLDDATYGGRVTDVSDLFLDPTATGQGIEATVSLRVDYSNVMPAAKKQRTQAGAAPTVDLEKLVKTYQSDAEPESRLIRVGDVREQHQEHDDDIAQEFPLMALPDAATGGSVRLWGTQAWVLGNRSTGGLGLQQESKPFQQNYLWFGGFKGVKNGKSLRKRIVDDGMPGDPRMPFLPPLTFNRFDPTACHPPLRKTEIAKNRKVVAAVRFVSHVPEAAGLEYYENFQIIIENSDTSNTVADHIRTELANNKSTKALFEPALKNRWVMQLWALPQSSEPQKLFRLEHAVRLNSFLSPAGMKERPSKLYMEAHIWSIDDVVEEDDIESHAAEENEEDDSRAHEEEHGGRERSRQTSQRSVDTTQKAPGKSGGVERDPEDESGSQSDIEGMPPGFLEQTRIQANEEQAKRVKRAMMLSENEHAAKVGEDDAGGLEDDDLDGALTADDFADRTADAVDEHDSPGRRGKKGNGSDGGNDAERTLNTEDDEESAEQVAAIEHARGEDGMNEGEPDTSEQAKSSADINGQEENKSSSPVTGGPEPPTKGKDYTKWESHVPAQHR